MTVEEYQAMCASGKITSGVVDLLPPLNASVVIGGVYMTRDGGKVTIKGVAHTILREEVTHDTDTPDGSVVWSSKGDWYVAATGEIIRQSQFHGLSKLIELVPLVK
jgi:hypothetical protein